MRSSNIASVEGGAVPESAGTAPASPLDTRSEQAEVRIALTRNVENAARVSVIDMIETQSTPASMAGATATRLR
jgi:hypothetical protein